MDASTRRASVTAIPSATSSPTVDDDLIVTELVALSAQDGGDQLYQFRSLAGARQYRRLYQRFRRYVSPGARVLDWGAGSGHFSYFLWRAGYRATGFSFDRLSPGAWLTDPSYRCVHGTEDDPVTLPFPDESFDAVASVGVLEHVRETGGNEPASLAEIARVLCPRGVFVCFHFPNRFSLVESASRRLGRESHRYSYTRRDIEQLTRGAGFRVLEAQRYGLLPRNSCGGLPRPLLRSRPLAVVWDVVDGVLGTVFSPLCQNFLFVASKDARA